MWRKMREEPMPPIDVINWMDTSKMQTGDKEKLKKDFEAKIANLKQVLAALEKGLDKLK
jgi:hypothetical protein